jgi:hypothetical protein
MDAAVAHRIARAAHAGQSTRFGEPMIAHLERVAAAVPPHARVTALLHDVLERDPAARSRLVAEGLSETELATVDLLTHLPGESYEAFVRKIADTPGAVGRLARLIKLADIEDHLAHAVIPADAPPYAAARRRLLSVRGRGKPPARAA